MNIKINTAIKEHLRSIGMGEDTLDDCLDNLKIVVCTGTNCQVFDREGSHKDVIDFDHTNQAEFQEAFWNTK